MAQDRSRIWLGIILLAYLIIATLYAVKVPAWQAPDEPAHYNYVRALATTGQFPVLRMGDYDEDYLNLLTSQGFPPELSTDPLRYEAHQLPLYYIVQAPVFLLSNGSLLALRLVSVLLGAALILLTRGIADMIFPHQAWLSLGSAAFVAFLPMHVAMAAAINNDALAEVAIAASILLAIRYVRLCLFQPQRVGALDALLLGLFLGLALISKVSAYVAIPVVLAALIIGWYETRRRVPGAIQDTEPGGQLQETSSTKQPDEGMFPTRHAPDLPQQFALVLAPALMMVLPWYARNARLYGNLDILARRWHDTVVVGQLRAGEFIATRSAGALIERFLVWSHNSFWGVFGWMGVWMDSRLYTVLLSFGLAILVGLIGLAARHWTVRMERIRLAAAEPETGQAAQVLRFQRWALGLLALSAVLTLGVYVSYNLIFVQPQGRYLFPALPAIALAVAAGWREVLRPSTSRWAAFGLLAAAVIAGVWGVLRQDINPWSLSILAGGSIVALLWSLLVPRLAPRPRQSLTDVAFAAPFFGLLALDVLALYAFILPQLA